ncbi:hypothetical protein [Nonomuraea sp. NPDC048826]|uniref:hypothetical protein n=1 Tax=Nonomuraea sp. NPDC048826 TaxID=3364347 RepID=UPI00371F9B5C
MENFWTGAIAGLLGAFVGGFFTAWGARLQVRGMLDAARLEIDATVRQERKTRQVAAQHTALVEMFRIVGRCMHLLDDELDRHRPHDTGADCEGLASSELRQARTELECAYWAYIHEIDEDDDNKTDPTPIEKLMFFLYDICYRDADRAAKHIPDFAKDGSVKDCNYHLAINLTGTILAFDAVEYLRIIRKTVDLQN